MDAQANGGTFSVKKLQEEVNEIDKKLAKLHSSPKTEGLSFEEIGFDYLLWTRRTSIRICLRTASPSRE